MNVHKNARSCPVSRALLVKRVSELGFSVRAASEAAGMSDRRGREWVRRGKREEPLTDRSSRPLGTSAIDSEKRVQIIELRRDALEVERWNRLHPDQPERVPYLFQALKGSDGPIVAASDYIKSLPDQLAPWLKDRLVSLGTDGFGRSDNRKHLRRFFENDGESIAAAALSRLARRVTHRWRAGRQASAAFAARLEANTSVSPSLDKAGC